MGQDRTRLAQVEIINGQLERARNSSLYGLPESRAGRFDQLFAAEKLMAARLLREAHAAQLVWANWEAINDQLASSEARNAILDLELGALPTIRGALARDAILKSFRISDGVGSGVDRDTLRCFAVRLADSGIRTLLESEEWARNLGYHPAMVQSGRERNAAIVARIIAAVSIDAKTSPANSELFELRSKLRPVRDRLAHALAVDNLNQPIVNEIRRFIELTLDLTTDVSVLFLGSAAPAGSVVEHAQSQAERFWVPVFSQFVSEHLERQRRLAD